MRGKKYSLIKTPVLITNLFVFFLFATANEQTKKQSPKSPSIHIKNIFYDEQTLKLTFCRIYYYNYSEMNLNECTAKVCLIINNFPPRYSSTGTVSLRYACLLSVCYHLADIVRLCSTWPGSTPFFFLFFYFFSK